jgi:predicted component of type VI protein secretion system
MKMKALKLSLVASAMCLLLAGCATSHNYSTDNPPLQPVYGSPAKFTFGDLFLDLAVQAAFNTIGIP